MKRTAFLICILGLMLTACQVESSATPDSPVQAEDQITPALTSPVDTGAQSLAERTRGDLAQRLGVSVDTITVTAVIGQDFLAEAFRCRASKERTAKEESSPIISGYSVLLSVSERRYEYHVSDEAVVFCRALN